MDADGLTNYDETHVQPERCVLAGDLLQPGAAPSPSARSRLDLADPDVDGDTLLDGEDDQDHDDYTT